jgi:PTH1 family peptidyl-tRNA hydrolase
VKLVAGLGNPGPRYAGSRHNVGFEVVDELAKRWRVGEPSFDRHFEALAGEVTRGNERVVLLKPMTYMNLSGRSVGAVAKFYKIAPGDVMVAYDDLDLPVGQIRIRAAGSAGGQKGMTSVIAALGQAVPRVRLGIGRVHRSETVDHVLSRFAPDERTEMEIAIRIAADAIECWLSEGIDAAMNRFNRRPAGDSAGGSGQA